MPKCCNSELCSQNHKNEMLTKTYTTYRLHDGNDQRHSHTVCLYCATYPQTHSLATVPSTATSNWSTSQWQESGSISLVAVNILSSSVTSKLLYTPYYDVRDQHFDFQRADKKWQQRQATIIISCIRNHTLTYSHCHPRKASVWHTSPTNGLLTPVYNSMQHIRWFHAEKT